MCAERGEGKVEGRRSKVKGQRSKVGGRGSEDNDKRSKVEG